MKKARIKRKNSPKSLSSEQWRSESSVRAAAPPAVGSGSKSGSGSPNPPHPCTGTAPASVAFKEKPTDVRYEHPPNPEDGGLTTWNEYPSFSIEAFCDAKQKVWTCRVVKATGQQTELIGTPNFPLTVHTTANGVGIMEASCAFLLVMLTQVTNNMSTIHTAGYIPIEMVKAHEDVHRNNRSQYAQLRYVELKSAIEAISIPCANQQNSETAQAAMQEAIDAALKQFDDNFKADMIKDANHDPLKPFLKAQKRACKPFIRLILAQREANDC